MAAPCCTNNINYNKVIYIFLLFLIVTIIYMESYSIYNNYCLNYCLLE